MMKIDLCTRDRNKFSAMNNVVEQVMVLVTEVETPHSAGVLGSIFKTMKGGRGCVDLSLGWAMKIGKCGARDLYS
jgi:hypothetical protein